MFKPNTIFISSIVFTITLFYNVNAEVFTALTDMEHLLDIENNLIRYLNGFILKQEQKLNHIEHRIREYRFQNEKAFRNISAYVSNPINVLMIIKRLTFEWPSAQELTVDKRIADEFRRKTERLRRRHIFPGPEDLNGAAVALARLQKTYKLNTQDLANGKIRKVDYGSNMSASDCYGIGIEALTVKKYVYYSGLWFREALGRLDPNSEPAIKIEILTKLARAYTEQKDFASALDAINEILLLQSNSKIAAINKTMLEELILLNKPSITELKHKRYKQIEEDIAQHESPIDHTDPMKYDTYQRILYEAVCRGEVSPSPKELAPLRCRYQSHNSKFLKIAPLKLEEISLSPFIVLYHDVIYDKEIDVIKDMAKLNLERAGVDPYNGTELLLVDYRISKAAWFPDDHHKYIADVSRRVKDMSGLSLESSELLQVVNYGIGGFYETHFDYSPEEDFSDDLGFGNRIATVLFYMSDVAEGGATAFPFLKTAVFPKKGAAVYWLNLHPDGIGDFRTKHAGCPVLVGSKWVSNKWLHTAGQERARPCGLYPEYEAEFW